MHRFVRIGLAVALALGANLTANWSARAETTLRMAIEAFPPSRGNPLRTSLSPSIYTLAAIFDGLTFINEKSEVKPALAVSWEPVDALTWQFHLRPDVKFSNGAPLTSDAFVTTVNYLASDDAYKEGLKQELAVLKSARAIDDLTFEITTTEPVAMFPRFAAAISGVEPNIWRAGGRDGYETAAVGTGPFKVDEMQANRWRLSAFKESWRPGKVDKLELLMLPDTSSRVQALAAERVDVAMVIGPDNIDALEAAGARVDSFITATVYAISLRTREGDKFADKRVREAVNLAINRDIIISAFLAGRTIATAQPGTRQTYGYDPSIPAYPYDPERAKQLLAEAGYPNGFTFTLDAPTNATVSDTSVFQQIQLDLQAIGVTMNITTLTYPMYLQKTSRTVFDGDAFPLAWASWPTLDTLRAIQTHSCRRLVPWYCDESVMPLFEQALAETDEAKGLALRHELAQRYHDQYPGIWMYELPVFVGLSSKVSGFEIIGYRILYDRIALAP
ncbi:MAG: ABC transporter substrate-binding protein [Rhodobacteraceae bacterium]|nr:ABC transporter substrate-binding protein [Paracoccaceae bacterium]